MPTEDQPSQQIPRSLCNGPHRLLLFLRSPALHDLQATVEGRVIHDPEMLKGFRAFVTEAQDTFVDRISNDCPDAGSAPECCTALRLDPVLIQVSGNLVGTIALDRDEPVDLFHHRRFFLVDYQILDRLVLFVHPAQVFQPVTVSHQPTAKLAFLHHLRVLGADADRGLLAFTGSLPEANVVQKFIDMCVKALFSLAGGPDLNALLHEPLYYERRFILPAAQTVEHKNEQHIELMLCCSSFDFHDGVPGIGADLVAGDAFFRDLLDNLPVRVGGRVLPARQPLHRDVIVIDLADCRYTVKAYHFFHRLTSRSSGS